jgi:GxxExxY protein
MKFEEISNRVIGCTIEVHRMIGPGLLEFTYEQCLNVRRLADGIRRFVL